MKIRSILFQASCLLTLIAITGCLSTTSKETTLTPKEARALAKEAYIYANPVVDSYRILYSYFVDRSSPDYKAGWNEIKNIQWKRL